MFAQPWDCVNTTELRAWRGPIELPIRFLSIPPEMGEEHPSYGRSSVPVLEANKESKQNSPRVQR